MDTNYIQHHGIKGQRWGIRRFQNKDGSLTEAGKKKEYLRAGFKSNKEYTKHLKTRKKQGEKLTEEEVTYLHKRGLIKTGKILAISGGVLATAATIKFATMKGTAKQRKENFLSDVLTDLMAIPVGGAIVLANSPIVSAIDKVVSRR